MKGDRAPLDFISQWRHNPHVSTVISFAIVGVFLAIAGWFIVRDLRHSEPRLRAPLALAFAIVPPRRTLRPRLLPR